MPSLPILFAPLALLLPLGMQGVGDGHEADVVDSQLSRQSHEGERRISPLPLSDQAPAWSPLFDGIAPSNNEQVRIERGIILRISPAPGPALRNFNAEAPRPMRVVERPLGECIESARVGGVADRGEHLLMFMRDRRTIAARLEKGCSPRDFYRGFYMERSEDGKICVRRDRLMSRSGAKCQVAKFSELVLEPAE
ncbi:hypothetical protein [Qipengyuania sphaerica]|uniref:hypothetical protein n=1 Tax=Qipengyuania sphaerica TaxID=2867243 RepID=UPI001C87CE1D|nr:hypothetical protein [Qipengyuania sphaerica]MBX7540807.1 hypothetical protein [Qipengyuania sphaerica]